MRTAFELLGPLWRGLRKQLGIFALLAFALWAPLALGQFDDFDEGESAEFQERSFAEAVTLLRSGSVKDQRDAVNRLKELAVGGHGRSQHVLGIMYLNGFGVEPNKMQALHWFQQAAEARYPMSMLAVAEILLDDDEPDYAGARRLVEELADPAVSFAVSPEEFGEFRRARARGSYLLGLILSEGWGSDPDPAAAIPHFERAARGGERDASMRLAIAYAKGESVERSVPKAKEYFALLDLQASDAINREIEMYFMNSQDATDAQNAREASAEMSTVVTESILSMQTEFALEALAAPEGDFDPGMAAALLEMAAEGGYAEAQLQLGLLFYRGLGVERNNERAAELFRQAAHSRLPIAEYNLAAMMGEGLAAELPELSRRSLLQRAAESGLFAAQAMFEERTPSIGVLTPDEARALCMERAEAGDPRALYSLALRKLASWETEAEVNFEEIAALYERSATAGYARAQYQLGRMRVLGQGVPQDGQSGFSWIRSAAFQEYPPALHFMGTCYAQGMGVEVDVGAAFSYFAKSAALGYAKSKIALAFFYRVGAHVPPSESKALQLYLEAADEGDGEAAQIIANYYLMGRGSRINIKEGLRWLARSVELGHANACYQLVHLYQEGLTVPKDAVETAFWTEKLAAFGDRAAMKQTAFHYFEGKGVARNRGKALHWITVYVESAPPTKNIASYFRDEYEDAAALQRLGKDYGALILMAELKAQRGWSGSDPVGAAVILEELAGKGFNGARLRLARLHLGERLPKSDAKKGFSLLRGVYEGHRKSNAPGPRTVAAVAAYELSDCYSRGLGVKSNASRGLSLLEESAAMGYGEAQYALGTRYLNGDGVRADYAKGTQWLARAAEGGDSRSRLQVARLHLAQPVASIGEAAIVAWLKELVDQGSGEARLLLRRYGVSYRDVEYETKPVEPREKESVDPWAPRGAA